jgi:hypothetical protein
MALCIVGRGGTASTPSITAAKERRKRPREGNWSDKGGVSLPPLPRPAGSRRGNSPATGDADRGAAGRSAEGGGAAERRLGEAETLGTVGDHGGGGALPEQPGGQEGDPERPQPPTVQAPPSTLELRESGGQKAMQRRETPPEQAEPCRTEEVQNTQAGGTAPPTCPEDLGEEPLGRREGGVSQSPGGGETVIPDSSGKDAKVPEEAGEGKRGKGRRRSEAGGRRDSSRQHWKPATEIPSLSQVDLIGVAQSRPARWAALIAYH